MATTNISFATTANGEKLKESNIRLGLTILHPNNSGGVFSYKCIEHNSERAVFACTSSGWEESGNLTIEFNKIECSAFELVACLVAVNAFGSFFSSPTSENRSIASKAQSYGLSRVFSYTQAQITQQWNNAYRDLALSLGKGLNHPYRFTSLDGAGSIIEAKLLPFKDFSLHQFQNACTLSVNTALGEVEVWNDSTGFSKTYTTFFEKVCTSLVNLVYGSIEVPTSSFSALELQDDECTIISATNSIVEEHLPHVRLELITEQAAQFYLQLANDHCETVDVPFSVIEGQALKAMSDDLEPCVTNCYTWNSDLYTTVPEL